MLALYHEPPRATRSPLASSRLRALSSVIGGHLLDREMKDRLRRHLAQVIVNRERRAFAVGDGLDQIARSKSHVAAREQTGRRCRRCLRYCLSGLISSANIAPAAHAHLLKACRVGALDGR